MKSLTPLMLLVYTEKRNKVREAKFWISQGCEKPTYEECIKLGVPERTVRRWVSQDVVRGRSGSDGLCAGAVPANPEAPGPIPASS